MNGETHLMILSERGEEALCRGGGGRPVFSPDELVEAEQPCPACVEAIEAMGKRSRSWISLRYRRALKAHRRVLKARKELPPELQWWPEYEEELKRHEEANETNDWRGVYAQAADEARGRVKPAAAPLDSELFMQAARFMERWLREVFMYPRGAGPWGSEERDFKQAVEKLHENRERHGEEAALWSFWVHARHEYELPSAHTRQGRDQSPGRYLDAARVALVDALMANYELETEEADVVTAIVEVAATRRVVADLDWFRRPAPSDDEVGKAEAAKADRKREATIKETKDVCRILAHVEGLRTFEHSWPVGSIITLAQLKARGMPIDLGNIIKNRLTEPKPKLPDGRVIELAEPQQERLKINQPFT